MIGSLAENLCLFSPVGPKMAETHEIVVIKPKPEAEEIIRLTSQYFDARGLAYDDFDVATPKRDLFTERVDTIVSQEFAKNPAIQHVLSVACGTGRRELDISKMIDNTIKFMGVEASAEMAKIASDRGITVVKGSWPEVEFATGDVYDAALVLSAFGHVPTESLRLRFLAKISENLLPGAPLFFDVLNLRDQAEWGPRIERIHAEESLQQNGFDSGDVIYRKIGEPELCFYHYFTEEEINFLLARSGFTFAQVWHIGYGDQFGEILDTENGALLVKALKAS